ncbi:Hypothetical predicted protein [Mytilus galloprovincialis]|uniref:Uncharacterized protein n=2 Tax=Mytilus galloprovincialis TaxID=29158 RepID=A0A8B6DAC1_MYTGA|nr:Hypothetical predicted protein [Mytilus galloprovincialis]
MASETVDKLLHSFVTKAAIETAREQCPDKTLDKETVEEIRQKADTTAKELSQTLHKIRKEGKNGEMAVSHLTLDRVTRMKKALDMKTYEININEKEKTAQINRDGQEMYPAINLGSSGNIMQASDLQTASIVVEAIILVLEIIGIEVPDNVKEVKKVIKIVTDELNNENTLRKDVEQIRKDQDDFPAMAKDIFVLVIDCLGDGLFWKITKALLSDMPWYDWILTSAKISAFVALLVATGGLADIAILVTKLVNAAFFLEKLVNLGTLNSMKMSH